MKKVYQNYFDGRVVNCDFYAANPSDDMSDIASAEVYACDLVNEMAYEQLPVNIRLAADPVSGTVTLEYPDDFSLTCAGYSLMEAAYNGEYYVRPEAPSTIEDILDGILENAYMQIVSN